MLFKSVDGMATGAMAQPPETHRSRSAWGGAHANIADSATAAQLSRRAAGRAMHEILEPESGGRRRKRGNWRRGEEEKRGAPDGG